MVAARGAPYLLAGDQVLMIGKETTKKDGPHFAARLFHILYLQRASA